MRKASACSRLRHLCGAWALLLLKRVLVTAGGGKLRRHAGCAYIRRHVAEPRRDCCLLALCPLRQPATGIALAHDMGGIAVAPLSPPAINTAELAMLGGFSAFVALRSATTAWRGIPVTYASPSTERGRALHSVSSVFTGKLLCIIMTALLLSGMPTRGHLSSFAVAIVTLLT